jgi:myo-inositol-1(or 4)-monophosphatase
MPQPIDSISLTDEDISFIYTAVKEGGSIGQAIHQEGFAQKRKDDNSIVTEADFKVQEFLLSRLKERFPRAGYIHEENFHREANPMKEERLTFIIDPIDGTAVFSMGLPFWAVSVGVFRGFTPLYGFVYSPGSSLFYHNDDNNAFLNMKPLQIDSAVATDSQTSILIATETKDHFTYNFNGKVRNFGSTSLQSAMIADNGRNRCLAFLGKSSLWDWAGSIPIIQKAGGKVLYYPDREIDYLTVAENQFFFPDFLYAASPQNIDDVKSIIRKENKPVDTEETS